MSVHVACMALNGDLKPWCRLRTLRSCGVVRSPGDACMSPHGHAYVHASRQVDIPCTWRNDQPRRCMHTYTCAPRLATSPAPACLGKPELYIFVWKRAILKTLSRISWLLTEEILQLFSKAKRTRFWKRKGTPAPLLQCWYENGKVGEGRLTDRYFANGRQSAALALGAGWARPPKQQLASCVTTGSISSLLKKLRSIFHQQ